MKATKEFDSTRSVSSARGEQESYGLIGMLAGPLLGLLFTYARIGPSGLIWLQGKGGETFLTTPAKIIVTIIVLIGAFAGGLCGLALVATYRPEARAPKPKSETPQEHLWDRQLDG
jgi:hypothetical protein